MAEDEAIWHVLAGGVQQGPLTKAQVFEFLRSGTLIGSDAIWSPGFPDWKSVSDVNEFWRPPPPRNTEQKVPVQSASDVEAVPVTNPPRPIGGRSVGKKWSLWKSANIGLGVSNLILLLQ